MTESFLYFICFIAGAVFVKIASPVLRQLSLIWGFHKEVRNLEETLTTIKALILHAEEQQSQNRELQLWLGRLKILCNDADNLLDELEYHALRKRVLQQYGDPMDKLSYFFSTSNLISLWWFNIGHRLEELSKRLDAMADQKSKFHLTEPVDNRELGRRHREMTDSLLLSSDVIGRDRDKEEVLKLLMDTNNVDNTNGTVSVIPIVGMGGMGKTTFAKLLYSDYRVDKCFDLKIWIFVSEEFDKHTLMVKMIKSLTNQNLSNLDSEQLQSIIQDKLTGKKFLLVLDDVWNDDRVKWVDFRNLLERGASESKVIVTTRKLSVETIVGTVSAHNLKGLSHGDCVSLLKKWAFREGEEERYPRLIEIGNEIVRKCGGLPLAIRTLGTLLYSKIDEHYWKFIRDNEIWKSEQKETDVLPALRLSYYELSSHLKPCFVICSVYPKGFQFNTSDIGNVWMAHGLIRSSNEREDTDDTVNQYVKELHSRSFFQDLKEHGGKYIEFTMHDLVHDLALYLAQSETSLVTVRSSNISDRTRHIRIDDKECLDQKIPNYLCTENNLQTLEFPFGAEGPALASFLNTCITNCKYLRMLTLFGCSFEFLPSSIGNLKHLRYLDLRQNTKLRKLPDSICKLHNLLALFVTECPELEELPRNVRNLINLRVLQISVKQKHLQEDGIWLLTSLRSLIFVDCPNLEHLSERIQSLTYLRVLRTTNCKSLVSLPQILSCLTALKMLLITGCHQLKWTEEEDDNQDLIKVSLEFLYFHDLPQLKTLPQWVKKYSKTLQALFIYHCENFSSMPVWLLRDFTELKSLSIWNCPMFCVCDEVSLMEDSNNQDVKWSLENLTFSDLPLLETLPQWLHKCSKTLQRLRILYCENLSSFPEWLRHFTSLNTLIIGGCPTLSKRCQTDNGEDWYKIAHVPNIYIRDHEHELDSKLRGILF